MGWFQFRSRFGKIWALLSPQLWRCPAIWSKLVKLFRSGARSIWRSLQPEVCIMALTRKKKIWIACGGVVLLGAIIYFSINATRKDEVQVQTAKAQRKDVLKSKVAASGEIRAKEFVDLQAEITGVITDLAVHEGDVRKEGGYPVADRPAADPGGHQLHQGAVRGGRVRGARPGISAHERRSRTWRAMKRPCARPGRSSSRRRTATSRAQTQLQAEAATARGRADFARRVRNGAERRQSRPGRSSRSPGPASPSRRPRSRSRRTRSSR